MPKKTFTDEQIVAALRQAESGIPIVEVCRKFGVTETTFFRWRKQFAGLGISELHRLKQLEDENKRLKSLVGDLTLDKTMLQEVIAKKL
jgi:putative transposase